MEFVFRKDVFYSFLIQVAESLCAVQADASELGWSNLDQRGVLVDSNAYFLQLSAYFNFLLFSFCSIQDHQNHIRILSNSDNLPASTFTFSGSFNNTRKIQQLNFCVIVINYTRNTS